MCVEWTGRGGIGEEEQEQAQSKGVSEVPRECERDGTYCRLRECFLELVEKFFELEGFMLEPVMNGDGRCCGSLRGVDMNEAPACAVAFEIGEENVGVFFYGDPC